MKFQSAVSLGNFLKGIMADWLAKRGNDEMK